MLGFVSFFQTLMMTMCTDSLWTMTTAAYHQQQVGVSECRALGVLKEDLVIKKG